MYKYLTANNTHKYINALEGMIKKYNNTVHSSIQIKPKDVVRDKSITEVFNAIYENYKPIFPFYKFDIGDEVKIVKRKKTFKKGYVPNWSEELFVIDKQFDTSPVTYSLKDRVLKQDFKKKLAFVKWKGYDERFNSWVKLSELKIL